MKNIALVWCEKFRELKDIHKDDTVEIVKQFTQYCEKCETDLTDQWKLRDKLSLRT